MKLQKEKLHECETERLLTLSFSAATLFGPHQNSSDLVLQGEDPGAKPSPVHGSDLLSGSVQQIEQGGCALCLQLKMKRDNISRVENYRG